MQNVEKLFVVYLSAKLPGYLLLMQIFLLYQGVHMFSSIRINLIFVVSIVCGFLVTPLQADLSRPSPPQELVATPGDRVITLSWKAVEDAQGYLLYYGTDSTINTIIFDSYERRIAVAETTSYTVEGLAPDTQYYFIVASVREGRLSYPSEIVSARVDPSCTLLNEGKTAMHELETAELMALYQGIREIDPDGNKHCTPHIYGEIAKLYIDAGDLKVAEYPIQAARLYKTGAAYHQAFAYGLLCQQGSCAKAEALWKENPLLQVEP